MDTHTGTYTCAHIHTLHNKEHHQIYSTTAYAMTYDNMKLDTHIHTCARAISDYYRNITTFNKNFLLKMDT